MEFITTSPEDAGMSAPRLLKAMIWMDPMLLFKVFNKTINVTQHNKLLL